jgi:hypothetical protein
MKHPLATAIIVALLISVGITTPAQAHHTPPKPLPCPQWHDALRKHGLPVKVFAPIMARESACQPRAIGWNYHKGKSHRDCKLSHARTYRRCKAVKSYDVGLLQINSSHKTLTSRVCKYEYGKMLILQKPDCNLKVAAVLYDNGRGVSNWRATSGAIISSNR